MAMGSPVRLYPQAELSFWWGHVLLPLAALVGALAVIGWADLDRSLAQAWFFDARSGRWLGSGTGDWWAHRWLHDGGRWLVRAVAAGALLLWVLTYITPALRAWRGASAFVALTMILPVALVGGLKALTNVDCPWDLSGFGGHNPYVPLLADRPDALPRARCFPGAHSASGFALLSFYFLWRDRAPRRARWSLGLALGIGVAFAIGQEARGAHFISHDLSGAGVIWFSQLGLYRLIGDRFICIRS